VPLLRRSPAISHAERVDPLAPVTVAVPTNACEVMTRRSLGRQVLDVDRRALRRRDLFDMMADPPLRDADSEYLPTASWERVSREAGAADDGDSARSVAATGGAQRPIRCGPSSSRLAAWFGRDEAVDRRTVHEEAPT